MVEKLSINCVQEDFSINSSIKIRYNNFDTETKQIKIPLHFFDHILTKTAIDLLRKCTLEECAYGWSGIRFTGFRGTYQINMFEDTTELLSLYQAIDKIKTGLVLMRFQ
jgi:DNA polymerase-4